jgi:NitT/TauT family transport system substrate-binding protein
MPAAPAPTITHQLGWLKGVQFGGCFLADAHGHLKAAGVTAEFVPGGPGTDYRGLVASGQVMISESTPLGLIEAALADQPLTAFAAVMQRDPAALISREEAPVASLADMAGRTIAAPPGVRRVLEALLHRSGAEAGDILFVPQGNDTARLAAGRIDAYYAHATLGAPALRSLRIAPHALCLADLGVPGYAQVLIARRDILETRRGLIVLYLRALIAGWRDLLHDPEGATRLIVERWATEASFDEQLDQARMMGDFILTGDAAKHGLLWISPEPVEEALAFARGAGLAPDGDRIDVGALVDQSLVREALA